MILVEFTFINKDTNVVTTHQVCCQSDGQITGALDYVVNNNELDLNEYSHVTYTTKECDYASPQELTALENVNQYSLKWNGNTFEHKQPSRHHKVIVDNVEYTVDRKELRSLLNKAVSKNNLGAPKIDSNVVITLNGQ